MAYSGDGSVRAASGQPIGTVVRGDDERTLALCSLKHAISAALGSGQVAQVQLRVVAGTAGRQILETAREARAQLIVLATKGSVSLLIGTVSQYVLRRATCPVLVVPPATS
jgi:nucleotide-binding universal stress UspA family protein